MLRGIAGIFIVLMVMGLIASCFDDAPSDPCDRLEYWLEQADAEGDYFEYEDRIDSARRLCKAQYGY